MAINDPSLTGQQVAALITQRLTALRNAVDSINDLYGWTSGIALADLEGLGLSAAWAGNLLSAAADAHALALIYSTGLPPGTYPQPSSAYVYAASQQQVMGPR
jgi:hypothetical protein